jgi:hypothetical protein
VVVQGRYEEGATHANRLHNQSLHPYGLPIKEKAVLSCAVKIGDNGAMSIAFALDGNWSEPMGIAFGDAHIPSGRLTPAFSLKKDSAVEINFGEKPFVHAVPAGHLPVHYHDSESKEPPAWLTFCAESSSSTAAEDSSTLLAQQIRSMMEALHATTSLMQLEVGQSDAVLSGMVRDMSQQIDKIKDHVATQYPSSAPDAEALPADAEAAPAQAEVEKKEEDAKDAATMSMEEKVKHLMSNATEVLGLEISEERAQDLLASCDGNLDVAFAALVG